MQRAKRVALRLGWLPAVLIVTACAPPAPAAIPTAPAPIAQAAIALATAIPLPTAAPRAGATDMPAADAAPTDSPEAQPKVAPTEDRSLLRVQRSESLQLLHEFPIARSDFGVRVAFSPDGAVLLHNGNGHQIDQFDLARGEPLPLLTGFEEFPPFTISVSPDGTAVVADDQTRMLLWASTSGAPLITLDLPRSYPIAAGFYSNEFFYAVDSRGNVIFWDPSGWQEISRFTYPGGLEAAALFPDGSAIALHDWSKQEVVILDLSGARLSTVRLDRQDDQLVSISPDGDRLLLHVDYGYPTEGVRIVAIDSGLALLDLPLLNFRSFAVSSDWSLLATIGVRNELRLYRLPEGDLILAQPLEVARTLGLSLSDDASLLGLYVFRSGDAGPAIQVWGRGPGQP